MPRRTYLLKVSGKGHIHIMIASTKGRYALRVMADLAEHDPLGSTYIPLKDIADRQDISEKYLEAIVKLLVKEGLLVGLRGKGGGYKLAQPPEKCSVGQILRITEGDIAVVSCLAKGAAACPRANSCSTISMWTKLDSLISGYLDSVTVADLMSPASTNSSPRPAAAS